MRKSNLKKNESTRILHKMWSVEDPWTKRKSQLILTNERLIFSKKDKTQSSESGLYIPLRDIAKAYSETTDTGDVTGDVILKLTLKNGEEKAIPFGYSKSMVLLGRPLLYAELRLEVADWVHAISKKLRETTQ